MSALTRKPLNNLVLWGIATVMAATAPAVLGGESDAVAPAPTASESADSPAPIRVPPGFTVERVAGPPVVEYPIAAGFDDLGRLFVAHSAGRNVNFAETPDDLPNSVRMLVDSKGDGHFDRFTVFADKMTFPTGALWHDGALYVCSPPYLWRMRDTQGTGVADERTQLVGKFSFYGHTGDIHGPFLGRDGRLYWTDGLLGHEIHGSDGELVGAGQASRIYRARTDGSDVEVICGGGMDNPVMMAFTAEGEPLATSTLLANYPARTDGIIYCIDGGVYPHHAHLIAEFKQTGGLLPLAADLGHVSPSGITRYRSGAFGEEYRDNFFVTQFNTHQVQRVIVERSGAGFRLHNEDFLTCDDKNFRPTYVLEDADGSLLVVDTGGWFTIGCLTTEFAPAAKGGIYRVRREGLEAPVDPRGLRIRWDELVPDRQAEHLDDSRWAVRDRALLELSKRSSEGVAAAAKILRQSPSMVARRNAVWVLARIEGGESLAALRPALSDSSLRVRLSAAHVVGLRRDAEAMPQLLEMVVQDATAARRQAATALGRIGSADAVPSLLSALQSAGDRFLEHAIIYALIQIDNRAATLEGLNDSNPQVRRGALIALDQMDHGDLTQELLAPLLDTNDAELQMAAADVLARRGWAPSLVGLLATWLQRPELPAQHAETMRGAVAALFADPDMQNIVADALVAGETPMPTRLLLLESMARVPPEKLPGVWLTEIGRALGHAEPRVARQALAVVRDLSISDFDEPLAESADDERQPAEFRVAALSAATRRLPGLAPRRFEVLLGQLGHDASPIARLEAADVVGAVKLDDGQLRRLAEFVRVAGALELPRLLTAYERASDLETGRHLVEALAVAPGLTSLTPDDLGRALAGFPDAVRGSAAILTDRLSIDAQQRQSRLDELAPLVESGDVERGKALFFGKKASCSACHTSQGQGGRVGPDLSKIGAIRTSRELLQSVVFPSASFARGYEPYTVVTDYGLVSSGIIVRQTADTIILVNAERGEIRLARSSIETVEQSRVSIMPQGLDAQLKREDLGDLIAFLASLK